MRAFQKYTSTFLAAHPTYTVVLLLPLFALYGCGNGVAVATGTSTVPTTTSRTGNWQVNFSSDSGPAVFPVLSGYLQENVADASSAKFTYMELTAPTVGGCFDAGTNVFLIGNVTGSTLALTSTSINGATLTLNATTTPTTMTGTYSISGGCADAAGGSIAGFEVARLLATYSGILSTDATRTLQLNVNQNTFGNSNGTFQLSGSADMQGFSCFTHGTLDTNSSYITGTTVHIAIPIPDGSGTQLILDGTIDGSASVITVGSTTILGGRCAGSYGTATLTS